MRRTRNLKIGGAWCLTLMMSGSWFVADPARAQPTQPPTRSGPRASEPTKGRETTRSGEKSGTPTRIRGWILSFAPYRGEDDTVMGIVKLMPEEKGLKVQTMNLVRSDELQIRLEDRKVDKDQLADLLFKNLYCTLEWGHATSEDGKKSSKKVIKSIQFEAIDIAGTLEEVGEDYIIVKGTPIRGDWPEATGGTKPNLTQPPTTKSVKPKKMKLKTMEKISTFLNQENKPGDVSEFATGDKVELRCAYGKSQGILIAVKHPLELTPQDPNTPKSTRTPVAPPPRQKRRQSGG